VVRFFRQVARPSINCLLLRLCYPGASITQPPHDFLSDEEVAGVSLDGHGMDSSVGLNLDLLIDSVRIDNIVGGLNMLYYICT
jgi:hypothetical protein